MCLRLKRRLRPGYQHRPRATDQVSADKGNDSSAAGMSKRKSKLCSSVSADQSGEMIGLKLLNLVVCRAVRAYRIVRPVQRDVVTVFVSDDK